MPGHFAATYEATPQSVALVRNRIACVARACGLSERRVGDVKLAVSEAATNAVLHAYRGGPGAIRVEADVRGDELVIAVHDDGTGMAPRTDSPGVGLGLPVIASVADRVEIIDECPGTELRMVFECPRSRPRTVVLT